MPVQAHGQLNRWKVKLRDTGVAFWTERIAITTTQLAIREVSRLARVFVVSWYQVLLKDKEAG